MLLWPLCTTVAQTSVKMPGAGGVRTLESRPAHAVRMFAMPLLCSLAAMTNIPTIGHWAGVACGLWHCLHAVCMQTMGL